MLAKSLTYAVSLNIRNKGARYFLSGRVKNFEAHDSYVEATVVGSSRYCVMLSLGDMGGRPVLETYCDCPYFEDRRVTCKHIWAVVLAADANGVDFNSAKSPPIDLVPAAEPEDDEYDDMDDFRRPVVKTYRKPAPAASPPKVRPWAKALDELKRRSPNLAMPAPASPKPCRLIFVLAPSFPYQADNLLAIEVMNQERLKSGRWGRARSGNVRNLESLAEPLDKQILSLFHTVERGDIGYSSYRPQLPPQYIVPRSSYDSVLPLLCDGGRLFASNNLSVPLKWNAEPWRFACEWQKSKKGDAFTMTGVFRRGEQAIPVNDPKTVRRSGLLLHDGELSPFDAAGKDQWLAVFSKHGKLEIPLAMKEEFVRDFASAGALPADELPAEFGVTTVREAMRPHVVIRAGAQGTGFLRADLRFLYGETAIPLRTAGHSFFDEQKNILIERDAAAEQQARSQMYDAGFRGDGLPDWWLTNSKLPKATRYLLGKGWKVEAEGKLYRTGGQIDIQVSTEIDWFELKAHVDFDGQTASLPRLLEALRRGDNLVPLDDGSFGLLPEDWLKKYGIFAEAGKTVEDTVRFTKSQVGLLDALLAAQPEADIDAGFRKAREKFRSFAGVEAVDPPESFQGELRGYQREGLGWLRFLQDFGWGGCLADDMGLGKTVQVLALLADRARSRPKDVPRTSLAVVPRSLLFNWKAEAAKFAPDLKVLEYHGTDRDKVWDDFDDHDLVLTTYGVLRKDAVFLAERTFDYCILDESQAVKNFATEQAKAVRLIKASHRLAMSGTPIENHLGELWSLFEFLNPGMLGGASVFKLAGAGARNPEPETRDLLASALRPFFLRRTKNMVAKDLPAKTEQTISCELEPQQRKYYNELRDYYRAALLDKIDAVGMAKAKIMILEALLRLRQAACHPGLIDRKLIGDSSAKLDVLLPQLREVLDEGHKALVFSQFTTFLGIVKNRLTQDKIPFEYLDGKTTDRQARVDRFQNDPDCKLFLISLKAGGVGLNLTAAEYVFLLDPWWNPAVEAQAIDRSHRIGQTRPVFAYRLIARDTVEERVLELQKSKRDLADAILRADDNVLRSLQKEDLEMLLG